MKPAERKKSKGALLTESYGIHID